MFFSMTQHNTLYALLASLLEPMLFLKLTTGFALFALAMALASEGFLGLEPCRLCIYQRWPYAVIVLLGLIGLARPRLSRTIAGLTGLAFLLNSAIAFYHTGVERHWWTSAVEGCAVPHFGNEPQNFLENIMSTPAGRCDEIPWADPLLGLSMANYNAMLCFVFFVLSALCLSRLRNPE